MLFLFGWPPCQRSDMTLMEVSQHALDSLYIRSIWLLYIVMFFVNLIWYLYLFWLNKHCLSLSLSPSLSHGFFQLCTSIMSINDWGKGCIDHGLGSHEHRTLWLVNIWRDVAPNGRNHLGTHTWYFGSRSLNWPHILANKWHGTAGCPVKKHTRRFWGLITASSPHLSADWQVRL